MMKKTLLLTITMLMALWGAAQDRFYIEDFEMAPGESLTVSIQLDNEAEYTAFQSDLYLPDGFTASDFALTQRKTSNHTLTATVLPDGGIRLLSYSLKLKTYSGNSGALVSFTLTANNDFAGPVTITLRNTLFTTTAGVEVHLADEECKVTSPTAGGHKGDVNDDGRANISDVTTLIDYLLGSAVEPFNLDNADMNNDGRITITDVTALIDYLLSGGN